MNFWPRCKLANEIRYYLYKVCRIEAVVIAEAFICDRQLVSNFPLIIMLDFISAQKERPENRFFSFLPFFKFHQCPSVPSAAIRADGAEIKRTGHIESDSLYIRTQLFPIQLNTHTACFKKNTRANNYVVCNI